MSSSKILKLLELQATIPAPPVGAMESLLRRSLSHLAGAITGGLTDTLRSVENDAQSYQLSITVSAIGEQQTNESSTLTKQPGASSPMHLSPAASSPSLLDPLTPGKLNPSSLTPPSRDKNLHHFEGIATGNCTHCNMPLTATQHNADRLMIWAGITAMLLDAKD